MGLGLGLGVEFGVEISPDVGEIEPVVPTVPTVGNARAGSACHCLWICCEVSRNLAPSLKRSSSSFRDSFAFIPRAFPRIEFAQKSAELSALSSTNSTRRNFFISSRHGYRSSSLLLPLFFSLSLSPPLSLHLRIRYVFLDTQIVDDARRKLRRKVAS